MSLGRKEAAAAIIQAKRKQNKSFKEIAEAVERHPVWVTSALMGQQRMSKEEAEKVCALLGLEGKIAKSLQSDPDKNPLTTAEQADPLIYRLHEIVQVYGVTLKAMIEEEFGDGIMSAIDFQMDVRREENPAGDRVVVTMNGKFLPYKKW
jgi:cyanate lyase